MRPRPLRTWLLFGFGAVLVLALSGLSLAWLAAEEISRSTRALVERDLRALEDMTRLRRMIATQKIVLAGESAAALTVDQFAEQSRILLARLPGNPGSRQEGAIGLDEQFDAAIAALRAREAAPQDPLRTLRAQTGLEQAAQAVYASQLATNDAGIASGRQVVIEIDRLRWMLAVLAVVTLLVGVMASLRMARHLARPLERMARAAVRVADRDFDVRLGHCGVLEADLVADRFDRMVAALARFEAMNVDRILGERQRLEQIIEQINEGLVILDENGAIERINCVAATQLGLSADDIGRDLGECVAIPSLLEDVRSRLEVPSQAPRDSSDIWVGAGPQERILSCTLLPFTSRAPRGVLLVLRDVTDQRRFERMRTDFVLRASHELRTPVAGMHMALGLLREGAGFDESTRQGALLATLEQEVTRTVALVNALVDLSRLYADSFPIHPEPIRPDTLLAGAHERAAAQAAARGILLESVVQQGLPIVRLDPGAMGSVLDRLLSNALRHTPRGGRIELGARAGAMLSLWVADTGEGIYPGEQGRIFEPFVRGATTAAGTGLGLALSREIVHRHGGRLRVVSEPGRGARFVMRLPL